MFRIMLLSLLLASTLFSQNYQWPIRASQSLSATFCEYRSGHLHAGIDIKTWGEMEVPCLAIDQGYIARVIVGYNGYGRGLFLKLNDGNVAVYGHLELFTPEIEALIQAEQLKQDKYNVSLKFSPDQFPVSIKEIIGYSGTSGTEHPHLHFEIRDSLRQVINPQLFYSGVKDTRSPILDELLLIPASIETRLNDSQLPIVINLDNTDTPVRASGPFKLAINAHDRANGTLNKYNIYRADLFVNDSLVFKRRFDRVLLELTDSVAAIYPGHRGLRGWRFMTMYTAGITGQTPFAPEILHGKITLDGVSTLKIRLADIQRNLLTKELVFRTEAAAAWSVKQTNGQVIITRSYPEHSYERYQFFSGNNTFIPVAQTFYRLNSTTWIINSPGITDGVRALGALGSNIKWIVPPQNRPAPSFNHQWSRKAGGYILKLESAEPYIFPLAYQLNTATNHELGELRQTGPQTAESEIITLNARAKSESVDLLIGSQTLATHELEPMAELDQQSQVKVQLKQLGVTLWTRNTGDNKIYLGLDTISTLFNGDSVIGVQVKIIGNQNKRFTGQLIFQHPESKHAYAVFAPGKHDSWKLLKSQDSTLQTSLEIHKGGSFFLLQDISPPKVTPLKRYQRVKRGDRLIFKISDDSGGIRYRRPTLVASIDGQKFFPDYNPLRHELSFHVPKQLPRGAHSFELAVQDASGNIQKYHLRFTVGR